MGKPLSIQEVVYLLERKDEEEIQELFRVARGLRHRYFDEKIFLYGFLYFSTWCRNQCRFCYYCSTNPFCQRYRKTDREILEAAFELTESGIHLLDLTMGEDPFYYEQDIHFLSLLNLVKMIKRDTGLPIMVSWGALPYRVLKKLSESGADWFACYQETHNMDLFQKLRPNQDYHFRLFLKNEALKQGLLIEEGILSGVGESFVDMANSMETMKTMKTHQVRVMNFVPQKGTPMAHVTEPSRKRELVAMAVLRLLFPDRLIPASLDVYGINGLREKLEAGANVITSIIPPRSRLNGVAQSSMDILEGNRTVRAILPILEELGLRKANLHEYAQWVESEKRMTSFRYPIKKGYPA